MHDSLHFIEGHSIPQSGTLASQRTILFGPFRLIPGQRLLLQADRPVRLGGRALNILIALVEKPGELVSKNELMDLVWPDTFVEAANLTVQIAALRRVLGDGRDGNRYLVNIPGRGYRFVAPVTLLEEKAPIEAPPLAIQPGNNLPALHRQLIGRDDIVKLLSCQLARDRLVTIAGPGGIGKTSVALAVAESLSATFGNGAWLVDLAPLSAADLLPSAVASLLGIELRSDNPLSDVIATLRGKHMLLVLDNCEHVIEAAAAFTTGALQSAPGVRILATSREPLRVEGEHVHRLSALEGPPTTSQLSATAALAFPAVQLFVERVAETMNEFELSDAEAPMVAEICRQLDGIPLAIEFAAARIDAFGLQGLQQRLNDRLNLFTGGRRSSLPRHQTMSAALDWSYGLLAETEQTVLRRMAVFVGGFSLAAVAAVTGKADQPESKLLDSVAALVTKSFVFADIAEAEPRLHLLETTRAYLIPKLVESGESDMLARRHAEYYRELLEVAESQSSATRLASLKPEIDNIRAALAWAFGPRGDESIGVALAVASVPLWLDMALLGECHRWAGYALASLKTVAYGPVQEMVLQAAFGLACGFKSSVE